MRWISLSILLFCFANISTAQRMGVIQGNIFDINTLESLPGATIIFNRTNVTTSDYKGNYNYTTRAGNVTITYRFVGYVTVTKTVFLNTNDTLILDLGMEQQATQIEQIVVSAGKIEQRLSDLTVSLSIIEPETFENNHITDVSELLNKTSGVEVLDGQASIRGGIGYSYGAGSRVLALVDGLPALSADASNIKWQFLPLENVSQIEVIKGASSVMYGSSALNGVINIRSADAEPEPQTKYYVETGVFGRPHNRDWIWWDSPRMYTSGSFSRLIRFDNTHLGISTYLFMDNGYRKLNEEKLGRVNFKLKQYHDYYSGLSYGFNINAGVTSKTDFVLWEDADTGALKQSETTAIGMVGSFFSFDPFVTLKADKKYSHDLRARVQSTQNNFFEAENNNSDALNIYAEYQTWYQLFPFLSINAGFSQNYSSIISLFYGNHSGLNLAGYSQLNINPTQRLRLVAGMRIEHNALNGISDKVVPLFRTGLNFRLLDYTFLRASFGQGYRYPSVAEKYAATTLGAVRIFPNINLLPEQGWNAELGVKQAVKIDNINGLVDVALFYSQSKDLIEYIFGLYRDTTSLESFDYGFKSTNIEYSRVYGAELEFMLKWEMGDFYYSAGGGYVYTYPVEFNPTSGENSDVFLKFRRKHSVTINFNSRYNQFDAGLSLSARSKILNIDDVFLNEETRETILPGFYDYWLENNKGHIVIDFSFGYQLNSKLRFSLVAKNLFNKEYMGRPGDIMPHRNFSLRFSGRF